MMLRLGLLFLLVGVLGLAGRADDKKQGPPAKVLSPKDGTEVDRTEELEGEVDPKRGWPVVLIRSAKGGEPWWVQPPVTEVERQKFTLKVYFGEENTPQTAFKVVIILAKDRAAAQMFVRGAQLVNLPDGLPRSDCVTVSRRAP